jgi:hypothetical protein
MAQQQTGEGGPDNALCCKFSLFIPFELHLRLAHTVGYDHIRHLSQPIAVFEL